MSVIVVMVIVDEYHIFWFQVECSPFNCLWLVQGGAIVLDMLMRGSESACP